MELLESYREKLQALRIAYKCETATDKRSEISSDIARIKCAIAQMERIESGQPETPENKLTMA